MCLSSLFKEIQPFENDKIHRNVLEFTFHMTQNSLEHVCMSVKFPQEILVGIPGGGGGGGEKIPMPQTYSHPFTLTDTIVIR